MTVGVLGVTSVDKHRSEPTDRDLTVELREAIDYLTLPYEIPVPQDFEVYQVTKVRHEPRLAQLRAAVHGTTGKHGYGSNEPGLPINENALKMYADIEEAIDTWLEGIDAHTAAPTAEGALRAWYVAWLASKPEASAELATLRAWGAQIEGLFNPPITLELTLTKRDVNGRSMTRFPECPDCGCWYRHDPYTRDQSAALVLEYREIGKQTVEQAKVRCRACGKTWEGGSGIRLVAYEIEQQQAALDEQVTA